MPWWSADCKLMKFEEKQNSHETWSIRVNPRSVKFFSPWSVTLLFANFEILQTVWKHLNKFVVRSTRLQLNFNFLFVDENCVVFSAFPKEILSRNFLATLQHFPVDMLSYSMSRLSHVEMFCLFKETLQFSTIKFHETILIFMKTHHWPQDIVHVNWDIFLCNSTFLPKHQTKKSYRISSNYFFV